VFLLNAWPKDYVIRLLASCADYPAGLLSHLSAAAMAMVAAAASAL
jgi:hypothetical protein